jgi:hypothetical protein
MNATITPGKESLCVQDITQYDILDTASEQDFNHLAELAALSCNCPVAVISFAGMQKQWLNIKSNSFFYQAPLHDILNTALCNDEVLVITDVINDQRLPVALTSGHYSSILFYAGTPILSPEGNLLGHFSKINFYRRSKECVKIDSPPGGAGIKIKNDQQLRGKTGRRNGRGRKENESSYHFRAGDRESFYRS